jgi:hypothetical protein
MQSGLIPDLQHSGQNSGGSRDIGRRDTPLKAYRHGSWMFGPLRVTASVIFRIGISS